MKTLFWRLVHCAIAEPALWLTASAWAVTFYDWTAEKAYGPDVRAVPADGLRPRRGRLSTLDAIYAAGKAAERDGNATLADVLGTVALLWAAGSEAAAKAALDGVAEPFLRGLAAPEDRTGALRRGALNERCRHGVLARYADRFGPFVVATDCGCCMQFIDDANAVIRSSFEMPGLGRITFEELVAERTRLRRERDEAMAFVPRDWRPPGWVKPATVLLLAFLTAGALSAEPLVTSTCSPEIVTLCGIISRRDGTDAQPVKVSVGCSGVMLAPSGDSVVRLVPCLKETPLNLATFTEMVKELPMPSPVVVRMPAGFVRTVTAMPLASNSAAGQAKPLDDLPNPTITPGAVRVTETEPMYPNCPTAYAVGQPMVPPANCPGPITEKEVCESHGTKRLRHTAGVTKRSVCAAYGIADKAECATTEDDHLVPLELGGSDDRRNHFPEPWAGDWGAAKKDKLEGLLWRLVCEKHALPIERAWRCLAEEWTKCYVQAQAGQYSEMGR